MPADVPAGRTPNMCGHKEPRMAFNKWGNLTIEAGKTIRVGCLRHASNPPLYWRD